MCNFPHAPPPTQNRSKRMGQGGRGLVGREGVPMKAPQRGLGVTHSPHSGECSPLANIVLQQHAAAFCGMLLLALVGTRFPGTLNSQTADNRHMAVGFNSSLFTLCLWWLGQHPPQPDDAKMFLPICDRSERGMARQAERSLNVASRAGLAGIKGKNSHAGEHSSIPRLLFVGAADVGFEACCCCMLPNV